MRIVISAVHYPISAARYLATAFKRLGHEVITVGVAAGGWLPWAPDVDFSQLAWTPDQALSADNESRIFDYSEIAHYQPDILIQCDARQFIDNVTVPNVCWAVDNHVAQYDEVPFDLFFGAHSWGWHSKRDNFEWLPCAYDPQEHYQIKGVEKQFDAAMVAVMYPNRQQLLNALAPYGRILAAQGFLGEAFNQAYNAARIALIQSSCGDVAMRVFENAAQGCLLFLDRGERDLQRLGLEEFEHYIGYGDYDEAVEQFKFIKARPHLLERIADKAQRKLAPHTYEARAQTILEAARQGGVL